MGGWRYIWQDEENNEGTVHSKKKKHEVDGDEKILKASFIFLNKRGLTDR